MKNNVLGRVVSLVWFILLASASGVFAMETIDTKAQQKRLATALYFAASVGDNECVLALLQRGADPNLLVHGARTPLIAAAGHRHKSVVITLLQHGVDVHKQDKQNKSAFDWAVEMLDQEITVALLQYGVKPQGDRSRIKNIIHDGLGNLDVLKNLSIFNTVTDLSDQLKKIPETVVAANRDLQFCHIYGYMPKPEQETTWKKQAEQALVTPSMSIYPLINSIDSSGWSALHWAAAQGNEECVIQLLKYGAFPYLINNEGLTPVQIAARNGHPVVANILINRRQRFITKILGQFEVESGVPGTIALPEHIRMRIARMALLHVPSASESNKL